MNEAENQDYKKSRTSNIWLGIILAIVGRFIQGVSTDSIIALIIGLIIQLSGLAFILYGCYLWTKIKNRHWAFALWGIISPIGLLGISLLKDKS